LYAAGRAIQPHVQTFIALRAFVTRSLSTRKQNTVVNLCGAFRRWRLLVERFGDFIRELAKVSALESAGLHHLRRTVGAYITTLSAQRDHPPKQP
jgi:hypothetical protein